MDAFLAWALPQRGLRWGGFRRNRRQVYRRVRARIAELGLPGVDAYRAHLATHPDEWAVLDGLCRVTISRFARDRPMWDALVPLLPSSLRAWSAGCGAGEEPFTLAILRPDAQILATDLDDVQLARAAIATYPTSSLRELHPAERARAFEITGDAARLRDELRPRVAFVHHDLRLPPPAGPFDLVLCRNLAYSYFAEPAQDALTDRLRAVVPTGGILVVGADEQVSVDRGFALAAPGIYIAR